MTRNIPARRQFDLIGLDAVPSSTEKFLGQFDDPLVGNVDLLSHGDSSTNVSNVKSNSVVEVKRCASAPKVSAQDC